MTNSRVFTKQEDIPKDIFTIEIDDPYNPGGKLWVEHTLHTSVLKPHEPEYVNPFEQHDHLYSRRITSDIIADSWLADEERRVTTFKLHMPKIMLGELVRHRIYSFSVQSARARSTQTKLLAVYQDPFIPMLPLAEHKGMQGYDLVNDLTMAAVQELWKVARNKMLEYAREMEELGYSHQYTNRLLEPFMMVDVVMTGDDWDNFLTLRTDKAAQFEIQVTARQMRDLLKHSEPQVLSPGQVHLPFMKGQHYGPYQMAMMSAASTARTSYIDPTDSQHSPQKNIELANNLLENRHLSPFEAVVMSLSSDSRHKGEYTGNLQAGLQFRKLAEHCMCNPQQLMRMWENIIAEESRHKDG